MSESEPPVVVIDNGSGSIKAGFGGDDQPRTTFPTVAGPADTDRFPCPCGGRPWKDVFIGGGAESESAIINPEFPIRRGLVTNWDYMEKIWQYTFSAELRVDPKETPVLLTEPVFNPDGNRVKMAEIMFESFHVPSMLIYAQPGLSLISNGLTSGIVVESGDGVTYCVPFATLPGSDSLPETIPEGIIRFDIAGSDVTDYLLELLRKKGCSFSRDSFSDYLCVREMKEKLGYVAADFDAEMKKPESELVEEFQLVDWSMVSVGSERFRCAELLFHPELVGFAGGGLHEVIHKSVQKCDVTLRKDLYNNIVLSGGNTMFSGIADRLTKEVAALLPPTFKNEVHVIHPKERCNSTWIGGSIVASLSFFPQMCLSRAEYDEKGAKFVLDKCPSILSLYKSL